MQKLNGNTFKMALPGACCVTVNSGDLRRFGKQEVGSIPLRGGGVGYRHNHGLWGSQTRVQLDSAPYWLCDLGH